MTFLPIVGRELRTSARQDFTYYLRILGAGALMIAGVLFGFSKGFGASTGGKLFGHFHLTLFCAIWIFVPFLTADAISRERREGTLALLFLTRMRAGDIVIAKGAAHGLRALTLWLAVLPVVTVPILLGGVNGSEAVLSALVNFSAVCLALAAGLIASSLSRVWTRVLVYAAGLSLLFCISFVFFHAFVVSAFMSRLPVAMLRGYLRPFHLVLGQGFWLVTDWGGSWPAVLGTVGSPVRDLWLWASAVTSLGSLLALLSAVQFAAWRVRRVWREEPPSARLLWVEDAFCRPRFFHGFFTRWMRRKLEHNPIGWLEQRSWSGRLVTWGWLGVVTCLYCAALTDSTSFRGIGQVHGLVGWLLGGSMALTAAGSFRRERETGVLELLLVSPLGAQEIISGRLRGLWSQFLPAIGLLVAVRLYLGSIFNYGAFIQQSQGGAVFLQACSFLSVPVIGLYFSLRCRNFMSAFLATIGVALLIPVASSAILGWLFWAYGFGAPSNLALYGYGGPASLSSYSYGGPGLYLYRLATLSAGYAAVSQLLLAALCWNRLLWRLRLRQFPFERTEH